MTKKSKCTYKRKRFDHIEFHFESHGEKRTSIMSIVKRKQKIHPHALDFLNYFATQNNISPSCAFERIIKESLMFGIEYKEIEIKARDRVNKIPKLILHPAYIEILASYKEQNSWIKTLELFILNYKNHFSLI